MPAVSTSSGIDLLHNVVQSVGQGATYKRAKKILERAISQLPSGRHKQALQDALPQLCGELNRLLKDAKKKAPVEKKKGTWASQDGFISAVHEGSDAARMLVQSRLPAHRQLLQTITSGSSVHDSIRACSRLCGASGAPDVSRIVQHACQLADRVLKPTAVALLSSSGSPCHLRVDRTQCTPASANIIELVDAINELAAISGLRAAQGSEPVELLRNAGCGLPCSVQGHLFFTLAAAHVCDSLLHASQTEWNSETFLDVHAKVVGMLQRYCVSVDTDGVEQFLLGHPVMDIDSLKAAPWAAVPMCAWLAVRAAVQSPAQSLQHRALPLQAVLLQRAELQLHSVVADVSACARETAQMREKLCSTDTVAWITNLPAGSIIPSCLQTQKPAESSLAALLLEHPDWAEIQTLNRLYLASLQPDLHGAEQQADDQSLFVLDAEADSVVEQWDGSEEASDQVLLSSPCLCHVDVCYL